MTPVDRILSALKDLNCDPKAGGKGWSARCPAHEDRRASLSIGEGEDGRVLVKCHAGCTVDDVCTAVGMSLADLMPTTAGQLSSRKLKSDNKPQIVAQYDYHDETGNLISQAVRYKPKDFRQRRPDGIGGWQWKVAGCRVIPYRLDKIARADKQQTVYIVEGEKDVGNLESIGGLATCNAGGAGKWKSEHSDCLSGRHVVILPDNDDPGRKHGQQVAASLKGKAASVKVVELPGLPPKGDVSDWIAAGGTLEQLQQLAAACPEWEPTEKPVELKAKTTANDDLPTVKIGHDESRVADEVLVCLSRLNGLDAVYHRAGRLVGVVPVEDRDLPKNMLRIVPIQTPNIRERITVATRLVFVDEKGDERQTCPAKWLVEAIANRGYYPELRGLSGLVQTPTIRPDGSILQSQGYDDQTGLLYTPLATFEKIPESPSLVDAQMAAGELLDLIADFPTVSDADRSAWLALVLTMIARPVVDGCCPLFAVTANTRGAGKSLLADVASMVAYGRPACRESYTRDSDELRKRITSVAIESRPFVLLDNIDCKLGGASLDAVITSRTWSDRVLGRSSSTGEIPIRTVWAATGNNLLFGSDIARRVLPIRLSSPLEHPEDRHDFGKPNLLGFVSDNRSKFVKDALTFVRAYFAAGRPPQNDVCWGSFESWTDTIRAAIVWAGLADPMETRETAREQDDSAEIGAMLIDGLVEVGGLESIGLTAGEICKLVDTPDKYPNLVNVVGQICGRQIDPRKVGNQLRRFTGRVVKGRRIIAIQGRSNLKRWIVEVING